MKCAIASLIMSAVVGLLTYEGSRVSFENQRDEVQSFAADACLVAGPPSRNRENPDLVERHLRVCNYAVTGEMS